MDFGNVYGFISEKAIGVGDSEISTLIGAVSSKLLFSTSSSSESIGLWSSGSGGKAYL